MMPPALRRLLAISRKEWIQLLRDIRSLIAMFVQPVVFLLLYGYAMNLDLQHLKVAVYDQDGSEASRALVREVAASTYFEVSHHLARPADAQRLLDRGQVRLVLAIPSGFERDLVRGRPVQVQALFDGADANTATIALGYTDALLATFNQRLLRTSARRSQPARLLPHLEVSQRVLYNEALESTRFLVPGLIALILAMLSALLTSGTIVRERERGTIEQLLASPLQPVELILGKLVPYVVVSMMNALLVVLAGWVLFRIWPSGSLLLLLALTLLFLPIVLGFGLLASSIASSQQMALVGAFIATVLPSIMLSGFVFPRQNMPAFLRGFSNIVPATHLLIILRSIYLKGVGLAVLWPQVLILVAYSLAMVALSVRVFQSRLE